LNPSYKLGKHDFLRENGQILKDDFEKYIARRDIEGISNQWQSQSKQWLEDYLDIVSWKINEDKTLAYYRQLKAIVYTKVLHL
jgi:hypothetical protein